MKKQRENSTVLHRENDLEIRANVQESDEESILNYSTLSNYGPCCSGGCQYCHPNCHDQADRKDFF